MVLIPINDRCRRTLLGPVMRSLIVALGILAFATGSAAAERDQVRRGHTLVQRFCAGCHAVNPKGASPNAVAPAFRDLSARYRIDDLAEALAEGILTGHPSMPEFRFAPKDVAAITSYLKSIQTRQEAFEADGLAPPRL